jgi:PAS domain S-box-containing protein
MPDSLTAGASRALLDTLLGNAPVGMGFLDRQLRYVWVNNALAAIDGRQRESLIGMTVAERVPLLWPTVEPLYRRALQGEPVVDHEVEGARSASLSGVRQWQVSYFPTFDGGAVSGLGIIVHDVTARKEAEAALSIRNDLYEMLALTGQSVCRCRSREALFQDLCAIAVNSGHFKCAWVGVPDRDWLRPVARAGDDAGYLAHLHISLDEKDPRSHGPTGRCARTGQAIVVNDFQASNMTQLWHDRARAAGFESSAAFPIMESGKIAAVLTLYAPTAGFFTDGLCATLDEITPTASFALDAIALEEERQREESERRRLEVQNSAMQKMEALGQLASGVAHDFNNLLMAINGFSEIAIEEVPPDSPVAESLAEIRKAGEQGTLLTRQLLAFSRKQEVRAREIAINDVVRDTANLLRRLIGRGVALDTQLEHDAGLALIDPGQLAQVLINLAVNARDAMPNGGTLRVATSHVRINPEDTRFSAHMSVGDYIQLSVSDTGVGMEDEVRSRIFEPLFTTKAEGNGTGLGLATVASIVQQMNGHITVHSARGEGTTFRIALPRLSVAATAHS